jgi:hypothetical protein
MRGDFLDTHVVQTELKFFTDFFFLFRILRFPDLWDRVTMPRRSQKCNENISLLLFCCSILVPSFFSQAGFFDNAIFLMPTSFVSAEGEQCDHWPYLQHTIPHA